MKLNKNMLDCLGVGRYILVLWRKTRTLICLGLLSICFIKYMENRVTVPEWVKIEDYPPYEPEIQEDFPTGSNSKSRIPHILHQPYKDSYIPVTYASNIKSFLQHNQDWQYFLWTERSAEKLIIEKNPSLLGTWDLYKEFKDRSEIISYIALYEFGGVYADMRTEWLRPLHKMTFKYACIFTALPFEKAFVGFNRPYLLNSDLIFCRRKHPFLKQIIDNLPLHQPMVEKLDATGPLFVTSQFMLYNKQKYYWSISEKNMSSNNSPFFYSSNLPELHEDAVFVPNTKYFPINLNALHVLCHDFISLSFTEKRGCVELKKRTDIYMFAFTYNNVTVPEWVRTEDYPQHEPEIHEDFPTGSDSKSRIPHILHQAYKDSYIPVTYASNIKSFLQHNQDWQYFLWTERSAEKLIIEKNPSLLETWDLYKEFKDRSEIISYIALYEFGGVYADMRTEWLRPLHKMTFKYACIFTALPFEKAFVGFNRPYLLNSDLIFCRRKHPFLKQIIDNLPLHQPMVEKLDATGPHFVTSQFMLYNKQKYYWSISEKNMSSNNSPFFYSSNLPELHEDAVFVPNTKYFPINLNALHVLCHDFISLSFTEKRGCVELKKRNDIYMFAFTYNNGKRTLYESALDSIFKVEIINLVGKRLQIY